MSEGPYHITYKTIGAGSLPELADNLTAAKNQPGVTFLEALYFRYDKEKKYYWALVYIEAKEAIK